MSGKRGCERIVFPQKSDNFYSFLGIFTNKFPDIITGFSASLKNFPILKLDIAFIENYCREAIENVSPCPQVNGGTYGCSSMKGDSVYLYVHWWHGSSITIANCAMEFTSGVIMGTNQAVTIQRDGKHIKLLNLPVTAPDSLCTVIKLTIKNI